MPEELSFDPNNNGISPTPTDTPNMDSGTTPMFWSISSTEGTAETTEFSENGALDLRESTPVLDTTTTNIFGKSEEESVTPEIQDTSTETSSTTFESSATFLAADSEILSAWEDNTLTTNTETEGDSQKNLFLEKEGENPLGIKQTDKEKENYVSKYIRAFIIASIVTVINLIIIGLLYSYNVYITQASQISPDDDKKAKYIMDYKGYLTDVTTMLGMNHELEYSGLPLTSIKELANFQKTVYSEDISYIQKRDMLKGKLIAINANVNSKATEIETIKKDIARYGFLPLEIRNVLQNEEAISTIQRSLNSLEIIKFNTALKVFSYMDSATSLIGDVLRMDKESVFSALEEFAKRGERDVRSYVYMCYLNPFETNTTSTNCNTIGDFDLYYQNIIKDEDFDRSLFKSTMIALDKLLEQTDRPPSFSILFNGFNASDKTINFNIEVNTTKQDETRLIEQGIKNPHIFIFTNLINLLKQSVFIIWGDINTKTITIDTRVVEVGNTPYTVNTSSKRFEVPLQKSTEREIFDYIDIEALLENVIADIQEEEENWWNEDDWFHNGRIAEKQRRVFFRRHGLSYGGLFGSGWWFAGGKCCTV